MISIANPMKGCFDFYKNNIFRAKETAEEHIL